MAQDFSKTMYNMKNWKPGCYVINLLHIGTNTGQCKFTISRKFNSECLQIGVFKIFYLTGNIISINIETIEPKFLWAIVYMLIQHIVSLFWVYNVNINLPNWM